LKLDAEIIVNSKDFPTAIKGAIVEVYHADSEQNKLLLQIMDFKDDVQSRGKYCYFNCFLSRILLFLILDIFIVLLYVI